MAIIKPFAALRPKLGYAGLISAPPFDVLNSDEAREMAKGNPYSFLRVSKPEIDLDPSIDIYDERVYAKAAENLKWLADRVMLRDSKPCLYIYRLTMNGAGRTGLVMSAAVDEYLSGAIKKHELTREDKERDRTRHMDAVNANAEPVFLAYRHRDNPAIKDSIAAFASNNEPAYDFVSGDNIRHQLWVVDPDEYITRLTEEFKVLPAMYIADGHHRSASAANLALSRRQGGANPEAEFNFTLSVVFPDTELSIMDYNRVVKDLNGLTANELLARISEMFNVSAPETPVRPGKPNEFGMYLDKKWRRLELKDKLKISETRIDALDVSILQNAILAPILGVGDPRADKRIDFVGGVRGLNELEKRVDSGDMAVAFSLFPTSMEQLMAIADAGEIMPPKSTWFEPKLRSGLFVRLF